MSVNFHTACSHCANIGGIQRREQELKAQYPKSIERKRLVNIMRLNLNISLLEEYNSWNRIILSVSFLCIYLFLIKSILSSTICLLATLMNEIESEHYTLPCKISKKFRY